MGHVCKLSYSVFLNKTKILPLVVASLILFTVSLPWVFTCKCIQPLELFEFWYFFLVWENGLYMQSPSLQSAPVSLKSLWFFFVLLGCRCGITRVRWIWFIVSVKGSLVLFSDSCRSSSKSYSLDQPSSVSCLSVVTRPGSSSLIQSIYSKQCQWLVGTVMLVLLSGKSDWAQMFDRLTSYESDTFKFVQKDMFVHSSPKLLTARWGFICAFSEMLMLC